MPALQTDLKTCAAGLILLMVALAKAQEISESSAVDYLLKYGYLRAQDSQTGALRTEDVFISKLKAFQEFAGLNVTGVLDAETKEVMAQPRCGVSDLIGNGLRVRRRKRYTIQGSKWPRNQALTYKITRYTEKLSNLQVDHAIDRAFKVWSDVSQLQFRRTTGRPDIEIYFASGSHGDGNPFDGSGKTLAHAFFPQFGGDAHFDDSESWNVGTSRGIDLFQVAAHEFGHSLGLSHSQVRDALMAPFYRGYQENFKLHQDDISAIQTLYGARYRPTTAGPAPTTRIRPVVGGGVTVNTLPRGGSTNICRNSRIDAVTRTKDGLTYVFSGPSYYRLNNNGIDPGYPRPIGWEWQGIDGPIDAAITLISGNTYLFKGSQYWKFVNQRPIAGYPRPISRGFRGIPDNLDAAFTWSGNGQAYFIKGSTYYRYAFGRNPGVATGYPRALRNWRGLPVTIDAAFEWENDRTYFFSRENYYRFNDKLFRVDPGYPRNNSYWWFGCNGNRPSQPQGQDPSVATNEIPEAKVNADQYDGPVLKNYPGDTQNFGSMDGGDVSSGQPIAVSLTSLVVSLLSTLLAVKLS